MGASQYVLFYGLLGGGAVVLALAFGWLAARGADHDAAWPHTDLKKAALTSLEIVIGIVMSPFIVVTMVLFGIPMLALSPFFLTDEYEEEEEYRGPARFAATAVRA